MWDFFMKISPDCCWWVIPEKCAKLNIFVIKIREGRQMFSGQISQEAKEFFGQIFQPT